MSNDWILDFQYKYDTDNIVYQILSKDFEGSLQLLGYVDDVKAGLLRKSMMNDISISKDDDEDLRPIGLEDLEIETSSENDTEVTIPIFKVHDVVHLYMFAELNKRPRRYDK